MAATLWPWGQSHSSAMARLIARRTRHPFLIPSRNTSSLPRPYKFHIGASWAGKPAEPGPNHNQLQAPFSAESTIGSWRDSTLSRPKIVTSKDAGEDFFYIQEVSVVSDWLSQHELIIYYSDEKWFGRCHYMKAPF